LLLWFRPLLMLDFFMVGASALEAADGEGPTEATGNGVQPAAAVVATRAIEEDPSLDAISISSS
jgi:hypothetical protein